ncbi:MAG TPA: peptide-methionine (S)-S-oxide reductase MsrA [Lentimicrobium sp.]|nr:peptide-methionine (S)-S-oxide reductase MsrA [Lentimicrobium sp.]
MKKPEHTLIVLLLLSLTVFNASLFSQKKEPGKNMNAKNNLETATFGSGCFWCTEAVFQQLKGVVKVTPGYSGGNRPNPTYEQVSSGATGHAEVSQIEYDPSIITFDELLEVFWKSHDPTTLNRQGADVGTQYRSAIFYHNQKQKEIAEQYKKKLNEAHAFDKPVITEITPFKAFYPAEDYHVNYYNNNKNAPYCTYVIAPKIDKIRSVFKDKLK